MCAEGAEIELLLKFLRRTSVGSSNDTSGSVSGETSELETHGSAERIKEALHAAHTSIQRPHRKKIQSISPGALDVDLPAMLSGSVSLSSGCSRPTTKVSSSPMSCEKTRNHRPMHTRLEPESTKSEGHAMLRGRNKATQKEARPKKYPHLSTLEIHIFTGLRGLSTRCF